MNKGDEEIFDEVMPKLLPAVSWEKSMYKDTEGNEKIVVNKKDSIKLGVQQLETINKSVPNIIWIYPPPYFALYNSTGPDNKRLLKFLIGAMSSHISNRLENKSVTRTSPPASNITINRSQDGRTVITEKACQDFLTNLFDSITEQMIKEEIGIQKETDPSFSNEIPLNFSFLLNDGEKMELEVEEERKREEKEPPKGKAESIKKKWPWRL